MVRSDFRSPLPSITPNVVEIGRKPDFDEGKIGAKDQSLKRCLKALMQWIHIGSVVLMIGGFFFFRVVLLPIANRSSDPTALISSALRRFSGIVWTALLTVLISGLYNFISFFRNARAGATVGFVVSDYSLYIFVLGIKLFIVFLIFTLAILLTFPYPVFDVYQKRPASWLNLTVILGLIVIFLSAYLRRLG